MKRQTNPADKKSPRVVVIGVGNLLLRDEGIGIHVAQALQKIDLAPGVEVIDGGTSPDLLAYTEAGDRLIIVDAAKAGGEPGTVYRLHPADLASQPVGAFSAHELGVEQSLKMMALIGNEPKEVVIIGVEPGEIDWGTELSDQLQRKLSEIVSVVLREIGTEPQR